MKIVFRVDASTRMGIGHLMRCLTLAEALRERGAQTRFICREHTGNLIALLQQKTMPVMVLPAPATGDTTLGEGHVAWLGVTQAEDTGQTIAALSDEKPDWLVVDHYGLDVEWEQQLRPHASKLMVIDDLANRHHECDVLLDQNYSADGEHRYAGLVPVACKLLVGPHYALLRPEYAAYRQILRPRDGEVHRVLVFFGGSDPHNMTGLVLEALSAPEFQYLEVDVVVGANNPRRAALERQSAARPLTKLFGPRPHLADLMAQADLAIGAGGATTWERMCLGLSSLVITIAENQLSLAKLLDGRGLIRLVGHAGDLGTKVIREALLDEIETRRYIRRSDLGMKVCDGDGVLRVIRELRAIDNDLKTLYGRVSSKVKKTSGL